MQHSSLLDVSFNFQFIIFKLHATFIITVLTVAKIVRVMNFGYEPNVSDRCIIL